MLTWLRDQLRRWLGIFDAAPVNFDLVSQLEERTRALEAQLAEFKAALKRVSAPVRPVMRYTDYESAQLAALNEFPEVKEQ